MTLARAAAEKNIRNVTASNGKRSEAVLEEGKMTDDRRNQDSRPWFIVRCLRSVSRITFYFLRNIFPVVLSAVLLVLSFPKTDIWIFAWFGLVPLFLVLDCKNKWQSFLIAYFWGVLFFGGTLYWLGHVTVFGMILMVLYLSLYPGLFGLCYRAFQSRSSVVKLFLYPSLWVVLEWIRAHLLTGFSWSSLALSQYKTLAVIQISDITGMFGVSFLIIMINYCLKECLSKWIFKIKDFFKNETRQICFITASVLIVVLVYGQLKLMNTSLNKSSSIKVAVVQANIDQDIKWNEYFWPKIMKKYMDWTRKVADQKPDLIIWPETSFPGFLWDDEVFLVDLKTLIRQINIPLLFGSVIDDGKNYFNSAILLSAQGEPVGEYHKMHLVPFGEFLPLRSVLPFLEDIIPIGDFSRGTEHKVFSFPFLKGEDRFSVLICFEDAVPDLVRKFVNAGARVLVNVSNDAWFGDSQEPFMHVQSSVLRAVENRRSVIRSANTGISGVIDPFGRIINTIRDVKGKETYVEGFLLQEVISSEEKTIYTKLGDVFAILCFGCILWATLILRTKRVV